MPYGNWAKDNGYQQGAVAVYRPDALPGTGAKGIACCLRGGKEAYRAWGEAVAHGQGLSRDVYDRPAAGNDR